MKTLGRCMVIDIETLAQAPDAAVAAIGAATVDATGVVSTFEVQLDLTLVPGLRDAPTIEWWHEKDSAVRHRMLGGIVLPRAACQQFGQYCVDSYAELYWGNSPSFDMVILRSLFKACDIVFPFGFRAERDYRTLRDLALRMYPDIDGPLDELWQQHMRHHDAMADALHEARALRVVLKRMGIW